MPNNPPIRVDNRTFLQRSRDYVWKPGDSGWRNAGRLFRAGAVFIATGPGGLAYAAGQNATAGEAREFVGNTINRVAYRYNERQGDYGPPPQLAGPGRDNRDRSGSRNNHRDREIGAGPQGAPIPSWMQPGAPIPQPEPSAWGADDGIPTAPRFFWEGNGYGEQEGPPEGLAGLSPNRPAGGPQRTVPYTGRGTMGNSVLAADNPNTRTNEAGDFARGLLGRGGSGVGSSSGGGGSVGWRQLMATQRQA